jgi:predicted lactoylglutathione lyase
MQEFSMSTKPATQVPAHAGRQLFVNLPVKNLQASMAFFRKLGFEFHPQFTDANAACMLIGEGAFAMLLAEPFFKTFTSRTPIDTAKGVECLCALSCKSRQEVDELVGKAIAAGGTDPQPAKDHGFMYDWGFADLDGHEWGVFWMAPSA